MPSDTNEPLDGTVPDNLMEVGTYEQYADGFQHGLVVLAMGGAYWLVADESRYRLMVEPKIADAARLQLAAFDRESVDWPPAPAEALSAGPHVETTTPLVWAMIVLAVYWGEVLNPHWAAVGALDSEAVFQRHEWWRPFTALFLHADAAHLTSNGLSGIFVFSAVLSVFGRWRGWLALALAAVLGNIAAVAIHFSMPYRSVGASTAVFAAVGLLTGRAIRRMMPVPPRHRWRAVFPPMASGVIVLALYGAGGVHVDVIAHLTGFLAGLIVGLASRADTAPPARRA